MRFQVNFESWEGGRSSQVGNNFLHLAKRSCGVPQRPLPFKLCYPSGLYHQPLQLETNKAPPKHQKARNKKQTKTLNNWLLTFWSKVQTHKKSNRMLIVTGQHKRFKRTLILIEGHNTQHKATQKVQTNAYSNRTIQHKTQRDLLISVVLLNQFFVLFCFNLLCVCIITAWITTLKSTTLAYTAMLYQKTSTFSWKPHPAVI